MARVVTREEIIAGFRPIGQLIESLVDVARIGSEYELVRAANPEVARPSHIRRLQGSKRWMLMVDGLVTARSSLPYGYGVITSDADHNSGKYVFLFPGGVFTVKRHPHHDDEGAYLQECLEEVLKQAELRPGLDPNAGIKIRLSVPDKGGVTLIATHSTLPKPLHIALDEVTELSTPNALPVAPRPRPQVRSTLVTDLQAEADDEQ
jgi:hypothetical protein